MHAAATNELLGYCKMFMHVIEPHVKFEFQLKERMQTPDAAELATADQRA
jgi:hypothetical protein